MADREPVQVTGTDTREALRRRLIDAQDRLIDLLGKSTGGINGTEREVEHQRNLARDDVRELRAALAASSSQDTDGRNDRAVLAAQLREAGETIDRLSTDLEASMRETGDLRNAIYEVVDGRPVTVIPDDRVLVDAVQRLASSSPTGDRDELRKLAEQVDAGALKGGATPLDTIAYGVAELLGGRAQLDLDAELLRSLGFTRAAEPSLRDGVLVVGWDPPSPAGDRFEELLDIGMAVLDGDLVASRPGGNGQLEEFDLRETFAVALRPILAALSPPPAGDREREALLRMLRLLRDEHTARRVRYALGNQNYREHRDEWWWLRDADPLTVVRRVLSVAAAYIGERLPVPSSPSPTGGEAPDALAIRFEPVEPRVMENGSDPFIAAQEKLLLELTEVVCALMEREGVDRAELAERVGLAPASVEDLFESGAWSVHALANFLCALGYRAAINLFDQTPVPYEAEEDR